MTQIIRGRILHCVDKPAANGSGVEYFADGVMSIADGKILDLDTAESMQRQGMSLDQIPHLGNRLIVPGFLDTHVHAPQMDVIASYGEQLLDWLKNYTFPAEARFADATYARTAMGDFLDQLLAHGTTTAQVFSTSHEQATDLLFEEAELRGMRLIAGKVLMDRMAPTELCDTAQDGYDASLRLIDKWHGKGRLAYTVTPRFSITSTEEQLTKAGDLLLAKPGLYLQTHLSENLAEIDLVKQLFPKSENYLDTYDHFGLCTDRSFFAHCVHPQDAELKRLRETGSKVAFCPSSNLFLGSGLFDWQRIESAGVDISLATDVGAGTSLSMLETLADAYKVCQLKGKSLDPLSAFYGITLGNARTLGIDHQVGNLAPGTEEDFLVLNADKQELVSRKQVGASNVDDEWFAYMMLGDERLVEETWVAGKKHSHVVLPLGSNLESSAVRLC